MILSQNEQNLEDIKKNINLLITNLEDIRNTGKIGNTFENINEQTLAI